MQPFSNRGLDVLCYVIAVAVADVVDSATTGTDDTLASRHTADMELDGSTEVLAASSEVAAGSRGAMNAELEGGCSLWV